MGNVCSSKDKYSDTFPTDKEIFDHDFSDEYDLLFTNFAENGVLDQMDTRASSFRVKPRTHTTSLESITTPESMPGLDSRRTHVERFFREEEEDAGFTLITRLAPMPTGKACNDSDSKSNNDSESPPRSFEDFYSLRSQFTESDADSTPPSISNRYDMTNWIWKPEEDKIRRNTHQDRPTITQGINLWNPFGRQLLMTPMVFETDSPPEIPRLSRRF